MNFENYLKNPIPFGEACAFLVEFHKLGSETEGVAAPPPDTLGLYAAVAQAEFASIFAYTVYSQTLRDLARGSLADEFLEHADEELEHAEWVLRRMAVLGGQPPLQDVPAPPPASDPLEVIQNLIQIEQEGIAAWQALHASLGDDPARFKVEEYLAAEQEHLDDLLRFLPVQPPAPSAPAPVPAAPGPPGQGDGGASVKVDLKPGGEKTANKFDRGVNIALPLAGAALGGALGHMRRDDPGLREDRGKGGLSGFIADHPQLAGAMTGAAVMPATFHGLGLAQKHLGKYAAAFKRAADELMAAQGELPPQQGTQSGSQLQADPRTSAFLQNEMEGQEAQQQNAAEFYKQRFAEAQQQLEAATQASEQAAAQAQQLQQQAEQNQMALSSAQSQSQQATALAMQQVMQAGDEKLQQQQQAAQMRMAFQELRGQLLNLASQEPPSQVLTDPAAAAGATPGGQPAPGDPAMGGVAAPAGQPQDAASAPAGQAPEAQVQPGQPGPGGAAAPTEGSEPAEPAGKGRGATSVTVKQGSFREHALGAGLGALIGGAGTALEATGGEGLREGLQKKISVLEQEQGSFPQAMRLVANKALLGASEAASKHPARATIVGSLAGAGIGAATEPAVRSLMESGRRLLG